MLKTNFELKTKSFVLLIWKICLKLFNYPDIYEKSSQIRNVYFFHALQLRCGANAWDYVWNSNQKYL